MTGIAAMEAEVIALAQLDLDGLRKVWRQRYGPPPALRSVELLQLMLAWRIQAAVLGGLDPAVRRQLKRHGGLREYQGRTVEVEVTAAGFLCDGLVYASLSAAATAIAGTRWNGPRFFGLRANRP